MELTCILKSIKAINRITIDTRLRSFQYCIILHGLVANKHLLRYKLRTDNLCTFCKREPESVTHLLYACNEIQKIWSYVSRKYNFDIGTCEQVMFNTCVQQPERKENTIVLITKYFIYKKRCQNDNLNVAMLDVEIENYVQIEKEIAK